MMDAQNFAYWLNGFAELSGDNPPTKTQWKSIKEHLALVFTKVTPPITIPKDWKPGEVIPYTDKWWTQPLMPKCSQGIATVGDDGVRVECQALA
jgi:hypothetical protein